MRAHHSGRSGQSLSLSPRKTFGEPSSKTRFRLCQMLRSLPRPCPRSCLLRIIRLHPPVGPRANALTRTLAYLYLLKAEVGTSVGKRIRAFLGLALRFTAAAVSPSWRTTTKAHEEKNKLGSREITRVGATQRVGKAKLATFLHVDLESGSLSTY